jgi:hypothetical protein
VSRGKSSGKVLGKVLDGGRKVLDTHQFMEKFWTRINSDKNTDAIGNPYRVTDL